MMRISRPPVLAGALAFACAALLFGGTLVRALGAGSHTTIGVPGSQSPGAADAPVSDAAPGAAVETTPENEAARAPMGAAIPPGADRSGLGIDALRLAAENDPFRPDRRRPPERYRMPGEEVDDVPPPEPPPLPPFRVVGTAVTANGGFALVQLAETTPRVVNVGERLIGYTLDSVNGEFATWTGEGRTLTFPVTKMVVAEEAQQRRGRGGRGRGERGDDADDRQRAILERLREQLMRSGGAGENVRYFLENGRVMVRPNVTVRIDTLEVRRP
jgi:hypothetical protein